MADAIGKIGQFIERPDFPTFLFLEYGVIGRRVGLIDKRALQLPEVVVWVGIDHLHLGIETLVPPSIEMRQSEVVHAVYRRIDVPNALHVTF